MVFFNRIRLLIFSNTTSFNKPKLLHVIIAKYNNLFETTTTTKGIEWFYLDMWAYDYVSYSNNIVIWNKPSILFYFEKSKWKTEYRLLLRIGSVNILVKETEGWTTSLT